METSPRSLSAFVAEANRRYGRDLRDYADVHAWSVAEPEEFWGLLWEFFGVRACAAPTRMVTGGMPGARWFEGARLNYTDQVFAHRDRPGPAIVSVAEDGERTELSWPDLEAAALAFAGTLVRLGVGEGDRVVGYLTNGPEAIVAFLGTVHVGAIWAGCAPDYGTAAAAARLGQLEPAVLVATSAYAWAGRTIDRRDVVAELAREIGARAVVSVERGGLVQGPIDGVDIVTWPEATTSRGDAPPSAQVGASHPLWVLFSSGTTGVPKGIVHGHGGVVAAHLALLGLQYELQPGQALFWYTTPNWMMWNIVASVLLVGATTVTYEGNPMYPGPDRLWAIAADEHVSVLGTSPGQLQASRRAGLHPAAEHDLSALTGIAVTGAPVPADLYPWAREEASAQIGSVCGGTDVVAGFVGASSWLPVRDGEISGPILGVAAQVFAPDGTLVYDEVGELVVTAPYPSMPVAFWNDPDGERYRDTYFSTFPGVWRQGDWATHTSAGTFVVHGRSDSTLNRNGVRFGSADIYDVVEQDPNVAEALVLGVERPDGSYWMPMFVVAAPDATLGDAELDALRTALRVHASPRHVPDDIYVVEALPHTRTGKKLEVPLKRILQGAAAEEVLDPGAIDRPDLIAAYVDLAASRSRP